MPRTDKASRMIAAPRERVYPALLDPDAFIEWLPTGVGRARSMSDQRSSEPVELEPVRATPTNR
jgi:uncharacterized protein YndB with AHSA1/START domain